MEIGRKILESDQPVDAITAALVDTLREAGISVTPSFDLQSACAPLQSPCPHHGTIPCNCQLIVLTVRSKDDVWGALAVHGSEGTSEISMIESNVKGIAALEDFVVNAVDSSLRHTGR